MSEKASSVGILAVIPPFSELSYAILREHFPTFAVIV